MKSSNVLKKSYNASWIITAKRGNPNVESWSRFVRFSPSVRMPFSRQRTKRFKTGKNSSINGNPRSEQLIQRFKYSKVNSCLKRKITKNLRAYLGEKRRII